MKKPKSLIIAHRGASGNAPENTLAAFQLAVENGADAVELDVHLTKDNHLAVIHNENVEKTTNGKSFIKEMTVKELKELDAGSWFHTKYKNEKVPLLEEVFQMLPPNILVNIEIKNIPSYYKGIEERIVTIVKENDRLNNVIVSSFDHECLKRVYRLEPKLKIGLLYSGSFQKLFQHANDINMQIYSLHPKNQAVLSDDIKQAQAQNFKVFPWTVNNEKRMAELLSYGVDGIITDYPNVLRKLIET